MTYINHVTLSTGLTRRNPRIDVGQAAIDTLTPWLARALASDSPVPLPGELGGVQGYTARCWVQDGALRCTLAKNGTELLHFGVAARSRQSGELWAALCAQYGSYGPMAAPQTPWCAVAIFPAAFEHPDAMGWTADFERCVAWAWIEN